MALFAHRIGLEKTWTGGIFKKAQNADRQEWKVPDERRNFHLRNHHGILLLQSYSYPHLQAPKRKSSSPGAMCPKVMPPNLTSSKFRSIDWAISMRREPFLTPITYGRKPSNTIRSGRFCGTGRKYVLAAKEWPWTAGKMST